MRRVLVAGVWLLVTAFAAAGMATLPGCGKAESVWPATGKKRVLVTFPALYCFVKNVAGDDADVRCLLTSEGPHDYQPTKGDMLLAREADIVFLIGLELDEFIFKMLKKHKDKAFEVGEAIPRSLLKKMAEGGHDHAHGGHAHGGHVHAHGDHDPHVWLGPPQAKAMVAAIAAKLGEIDPAHRKDYDQRAGAYLDKLDQLQAHGLALFKNKKSRAIVSTHDSLQYFADAFGLKVVGSIQPRAGIAAGGPELAALVNLCKDKGVRIIAVEPQYSRGPAETLQAQLAKMQAPLELVEVDPLETAPAAAGRADPDPNYYLERMHKNLADLAKALE